VASNVLRTHSETVFLLALAAASTRFRSSRLNLTGTMLPFAAPFASLGRPGFLGLGIAVFLNDEALYRSLSYANAKPHDRIPMDASHSLDRTDAGTLGKSRDHRDLLIGIEYVRHKASLE
jgi:hypothetical protein